MSFKYLLLNLLDTWHCFLKAQDVFRVHPKKKTGSPEKKRVQPEKTGQPVGNRKKRVERFGSGYDANGYGSGRFLNRNPENPTGSEPYFGYCGSGKGCGKKDAMKTNKW